MLKVGRANRWIGRLELPYEGPRMGTTHSDWLATFPELNTLDERVRRELVAGSKVLRLSAGSQIFGPGQPPEAYLLLISGSVRVYQVSDGGREIVLYRVSAGESCALTTACLMGYEDYRAYGVTETESTAVALPRTLFDDLIGRSPAFRRFVFTSFSGRITDLLRIIEDVAFSRIDVRLAQRLLELADGNLTIELTHQQLAAEVGTAREVVSRHLNEFQRRGWISTARGTIAILRQDALRQRGSHD